MVLAKYLIISLTFSAVNTWAANTPAKPAVTATPTIAAATSPQPQAATSPTNPLCGTLEQKDFLEISPRAFFKLIDQQSVSLVSLSLNLCYPIGFKPKIFTSRSENGIITERTLRGTAQIKSISTAEFKDVKGNSSLGLTKDEIQEFEERIKKRMNRRSEDGHKVYIITLDKPDWSQTPPSFGTPLSHPGAKNANRKRIKDMLDLGKNNVLDLRPATLFKKKPLKGAVNVSLNAYGVISKDIKTYAEIKKLDPHFKKSLLPKDKTQDVYVLSASAGEYTSYNFITYLKHLGYQHIYWFREGAAAMNPNSPPLETPKTLADVQTLSSSQVATMIADKSAKLIDTRSLHKKEGFTIFSARKIEFVQKLNPLGVPTNRSNITAASLTKNKEKFSSKVAIKKDQNIILFGQNEYDWSSYKAAIALKNQGFKNVYWFRTGMDEWKNRSLVNSKKFPLTKTVKKDQLYL